MQAPHPVKLILVERGLKQVDVAGEIGVGATTLNRVVNRRLAPWPALRHRLADYLDLPEDQLFNEGRPVSRVDELLAEAEATVGREVCDPAVLALVANTLKAVRSNSDFEVRPDLSRSAAP